MVSHHACSFHLKSPYKQKLLCLFTFKLYRQRLLACKLYDCTPLADACYEQTCIMHPPHQFTCHSLQCQCQALILPNPALHGWLFVTTHRRLNPLHTDKSIATVESTFQIDKLASCQKCSQRVHVGRCCSVFRRYCYKGSSGCFIASRDLFSAQLPCHEVASFDMNVLFSLAV